MAKSTAFSNPAWKQKGPSNAGFNLVPMTTNFNSVFDVKPLEPSEASLIENLLLESANLAAISEGQIHDDIKSLKDLTAEIKAIGKQGLLLMGERVCKAREMLKSYNNGTFTRWLDSTFGSKKTGYNLLAYYDFYLALPDHDLKEKFKQIPQKAAYILASRQGDMKKKEEIVKTYDDQKRMNLITLIQEKLPIKEKDKRRQKDRGVLGIIRLKDELQNLLSKKKKMSKEGIVALAELRALIDSILLVSIPLDRESKI